MISNSNNTDKLVDLADKYAHEVYGITRNFPKSELFGITSQLRRASLSVPLNLIEGHARGTDKNRLNFSRIAFGSLKESQYILEFCETEGLLNPADKTRVFELGDSLAAMLWRKIRTMQSNLS